MRPLSMACPTTPLETRSRPPAPRLMLQVSLMDGVVEAGLLAQRRYAHVQCMALNHPMEGCGGNCFAQSTCASQV